MRPFPVLKMRRSVSIRLALLIGSPPPEPRRAQNTEIGPDEEGWFIAGRRSSGLLTMSRIIFHRKNWERLLGASAPTPPGYPRHTWPQP